MRVLPQPVILTGMTQKSHKELTDKCCYNFFHIFQKAAEMLSESEMWRCDLCNYCRCFCMSSFRMRVISKNVSQAQYPINLRKNNRYGLEILQEILLQPKTGLQFSWLWLNYSVYFQKWLKLGGIYGIRHFNLANTNDFCIEVCWPAKSLAFHSPLMFLLNWFWSNTSFLTDVSS